MLSDSETNKPKYVKNLPTKSLRNYEMEDVGGSFSKESKGKI